MNSDLPFVPMVSSLTFFGRKSEIFLKFVGHVFPCGNLRT